MEQRVPRSDGFDLTVGGAKVGSFQTSIQADGTREMYVFCPGVKLHFGAEVVESVLQRTFARASNTAAGEKFYAGPGVIRDQRSTEALATFVVEEETPGGRKALRFIQGQYATDSMVASALQVGRAVRDLPWENGCKRAEYGVSLYDTRSSLAPGERQLTVAYSSASTGFGVAFTLKGTESW